MQSTTNQQAPQALEGPIQNLAQRGLRGLVRAYQLTLSPLIGRQCRFYPSCSHYADEAIAQHGALRGAWLAAWRVSRCHPWHEGGVDLVPEARAREDVNTHFAQKAHPKGQNCSTCG